MFHEGTAGNVTPVTLSGRAGPDAVRSKIEEKSRRGGAWRPTAVSSREPALADRAGEVKRAKMDRQNRFAAEFSVSRGDVDQHVIGGPHRV